MANPYRREALPLAPYDHEGEEWDFNEFPIQPRKKLDEDDKALAASLSKSQGTDPFVPTTKSERILAQLIEADEDLAKKVGYGVKRSLKWAKEFEKAEKANNLPKGSLVAVSAIESSGQPEIVGPKTRYGHAKGLMQFIPATAKEMGLKVSDEAGGLDERLDPAKAIEAGGKYLGSLVKASDGDLFQALMMYNWGPGNVQKWKENEKRMMPRETRMYLGKWIAAMKYQSEAAAKPTTSATQP